MAGSSSLLRYDAACSVVSYLQTWAYTISDATYTVHNPNRHQNYINITSIIQIATYSQTRRITALSTPASSMVCWPPTRPSCKVFLGLVPQALYNLVMFAAAVFASSTYTKCESEKELLLPLTPSSMTVVWWYNNDTTPTIVVRWPYYYTSAALLVLHRRTRWKKLLTSLNSGNFSPLTKKRNKRNNANANIGHSKGLMCGITPVKTRWPFLIVLPQTGW